MESKIKEIEQSITELKKVDNLIKKQLEDLQYELLAIINVTKNNNTIEPNPTDSKHKYLKEVNEQLFQQNVRIRQLIETCIENNMVPSHRDYLRALQPEE